MEHYDPTLTLLEARKIYFDKNGFGPDGGYDVVWVDVKLGPLPARFPQTRMRVRAVRLHDLHHVATGYPTTFRGECQIGAWEVASGCKDHWAAWYLNLAVFGFGLFSAPRAVWNAFRRGRRSKNLYDRTFDDALLARRVGDVREELGLAETEGAEVQRTTPGEVLAFVGWSLAALLVVAWSIPWTPPTVLLGVIAKGMGGGGRRPAPHV